jgi:hypothetical protein
MASLFQLIRVSFLATVKAYNWQNRMKILVLFLMAVIIHAYVEEWNWDEPLETVAIFVIYVLGTYLAVALGLFIGNLFRAERLLAVYSLSPSDIDVVYNDTDFSAIGFAAPYVDFVFTVRNHSRVALNIGDKTGGSVHFLDGPLQDSWVLAWSGDNGGRLSPGFNNKMLIRHRVTPDFMEIIKGHRGRSDLPLNFENLAVSARSETVGSFRTFFNLRMPGGWTGVCVPGEVRFRYDED